MNQQLNQSLFIYQLAGSVVIIIVIISHQFFFMLEIFHNAAFLPFLCLMEIFNKRIVT